ncbi:MAG: VCBS repeat-containing protein [Planctomycetia bacterium]|nr:VCBS repeat-containing protein [Planctomycetia bacterium]
MRFIPRPSLMVSGPLVGIVAWAAGCLNAAGADAPVTFEKKVLTDRFHAEAAGIGDIDNDGHPDVVCGPYWYAGPAFADRFEIYPPKDFDPNQYSNNFMTAVADVDGDGRLDVLVNEWPGKAVHCFRNPGDRTGSWAKHLAHPVVDNESPDWLDVTGDGRGELVFHTGGVLGFAAPSEKTGTDRWTFRPCSAAEKWGQYQHGLGVGDVNGDGRPDLLMNGGWWEQPAAVAAGETPPVWDKHPADFGKGGAQMHTLDVDGDGDADVITSLAGHGYGMSWFEQVRRDGTIQFVEHAILPAASEESLDGVQFSQPHAVAVVDVDGDGLKDVVTGKRFWAHGPQGDPDPGGTPCLYWFKLARKDGAVTWTPHLIDDASGVGTQLAIGDLNGDRRPDIVVGNKKGGFVFLQKPAG